MYKIIVLSAILAFLSGCATLSPQECRTAQWSEIGEKDGSSGYSNRIDKHQKACSKVNIEPDHKLYEKGYQLGLRSYCQPEVIFDGALDGRGGYRVCPSELHAQLAPFYNVADQYYRSKKDKDAKDKEIETYRDYLLDDKITKEKREEYLKKIKSLKQDKLRLDLNFNHAERELNKFRRFHHL